MKYFIDGGGNKGQSVHWAIDHFPGYIIHSFECYPILFPYFEDLPTIFHPEAIWINNGFLNLYPFYKSIGSTVVHGKERVYYDRPIKVPCIDFSQWLKDNFTKEDEVILKFNIEGAEYEVLKKMIKDGTIKLIKKLYIEFHGKKIPAISKKENDELHNSLVATGIEVKPWIISNHYFTRP